MNKIINLLKSILKLFVGKKKEDTKDIPKNDSKDTIEEIVQQIVLKFEKGVANLATDFNTKKVREIINYEFKFDFDTVWLQCTEYVQYKVLKELGIKIDWTGRVGPRDGAVWPEQFLKLGRYRVLDMPKKGCAMSFTTGCPVPPGHVAYVEDVLEDEDDSILISEANWPPPGKYCERILTKTQWQDKYKGRFIEFS